MAPCLLSCLDHVSGSKLPHYEVLQTEEEAGPLDFLSTTTWNAIFGAESHAQSGLNAVTKSFPTNPVSVRVTSHSQVSSPPEFVF